MNDDRNEVIDAFRGIAIVAVLLFHYLCRWAPPANPTNVYGYDRQYSPLFSIGVCGVDLFFVISGLVIAMTIVRSEGATEFVVKRFARLYPAYIVNATIIFAFVNLFDNVGFHVGTVDYLANWTMLADDLGRKFVDGVFWSLAVEIKFYALTAIAFALLGRRFWIGVIVLAVVGTTASTFGYDGARAILIADYMPLFLMGMSGWFGLFERRAVPALATGLVGLAFYPIHSSEYIWTLAPAWMSHLLIVGGAGAMFGLIWWAPNTQFMPLAWVGRISYSLYLLHQQIGVILIHRLKTAGAPDAIAIFATVVTIFLCSFLTFRFVEQPGRKRIVQLYWAARRRQMRQS